MARTRVQTFTARTTSGQEYVIHVYVTTPPPITTFEGTRPAKPGLRSLETDGGLAVNRDDKGKYHLVNTREQLTSDDPDAP